MDSENERKTGIIELLLDLGILPNKDQADPLPIIIRFGNHRLSTLIHHK